MSSSKIILLPIYNGIRARNFFRNASYKELVSDPNIRLIILIPSSKLDFYKKEFPEQNVIFEPYDIISEPPFGVKLYKIAISLLSTDTIRAKQLRDYYMYGNLTNFILKRALNRIVGPLTFLTRPIIRFLDDKYVELDQTIVGFLNKYNPDLVVVPDIVFPQDRVILRAARRLGFYTVGMIRSWDNLTAKGVIQILPNKLLVQTTIMKKEAVKYAGMPERDIEVVGLPHYDIFWEKRNMSRDEFLRSLGIPTDRKVVLTAPFLMPTVSSGKIMINSMLDAIDDGRLPKNLHILVRYRPATPEIEEGGLRKSDHLTVTSPCSLFFKVKAEQASTMDWEFSKDDIELLMNSLAYSDIVVNYISTLSIDAAIFDKPIINARFEADPNTPKYDHMDILMRFVHYRMVEATGGVKLVYNMDELFDGIKDYLANPGNNMDGRKKMVQQLIEFTDGRSGHRSAEYIKHVLDSLPKKS